MVIGDYCSAFLSSIAVGMLAPSLASRSNMRERERNQGMAWWRADQWRCRRAHVRGRVTTWMEAAVEGRERGGPGSLSLSLQYIPIAIPLGRILARISITVEVSFNEIGEGALLVCAYLLFSAHSIPHARALTTCPGGSRPKYRQPKRKAFCLSLHSSDPTVPQHSALYHVHVFCPVDTITLHYRWFLHSL